MANFEELTCPICTNYFTIPTFQCRNSHSICVKCFENVTCCPFCRIEYDNPILHNTQVEEQLNDPLLPCKNSEIGCEVKMKCEQMKEHELNCPYASVKCPTYSTSCPAIVQLKDLGAHLAKEHYCSVIKFYPQLFISSFDDFYASNFTNEYLVEAEDGSRLFISFNIYNHNSTTKNLTLYPLQIHSGNLSGQSEHKIDVLLRGSCPTKELQVVLPFIYYENKHEHQLPEKSRYLFLDNINNNYEDKSLVIFFYLKPAIQSQ